MSDGARSDLASVGLFDTSAERAESHPVLGVAQTRAYVGTTCSLDELIERPESAQNRPR